MKPLEYCVEPLVVAHKSAEASSPCEASLDDPPARQQPVALLAQTIGAAIKIPVAFCVNTTRASGQLKNITDPDERAEALTGLYAVDAKQTRGKTILLFDDLFRSGSTLNAIISLVRAEGSAAHVDVLTITRTRSNQ